MMCARLVIFVRHMIHPPPTVTEINFSNLKRIIFCIRNNDEKIMMGFEEEGDAEMSCIGLLLV